MLSCRCVSHIGVQVYVAGALFISFCIFLCSSLSLSLCGVLFPLHTLPINSAADLSAPYRAQLAALPALSSLAEVAVMGQWLLLLNAPKPA